MDGGAGVGIGLSPQATHHPSVRALPGNNSHCRLSFVRLPCRDLKPDNILLDAMGHAHITDFNVAIHYSERRLHTSIAGSMAYMAPEVVGRKGYTWSVDWWSLGVVMWELLFHRRPFDGRTSEKMTQSILKDTIKFPTKVDDIVSKDGQDFLLGVRRRCFPARRRCMRRLTDYLFAATGTKSQTTTRMQESKSGDGRVPEPSLVLVHRLGKHLQKRLPATVCARCKSTPSISVSAPSLTGGVLR